MDSKKKIVIVTDAWHPQKNGVVVHSEKMYEYLTAKGHEVVIIHPQLFPYKMRVFFYPEIELSLLVGRKMRALLKEHSPYYVHIATEGPLGLAARKYCIQNRIKFTTTYHTHYPMYIEARLSALSKITSVYMRWFHSVASRTMVSTPSLKLFLENDGFKNLVITPLGVDIGLLKKNDDPKIPKELAGLPHPFFIYFGRVAIEKNVEAFLKCNLPGTKIVSGGGPQLKELKKKYGKSTIFIHPAGYKRDQSFIDPLSLADVFVFPSKTETFGLVILEALACELPVAAYDVMGAKDIIIQGVHGFTGDDLEKAALMCLKLTHENLRKRALEFSWENAADAFLKNLIEN